MRMPRWSGIARPGPNARKKKEKFTPPKPEALKTEVSDGRIRFSYGSPEIKITTDPDGKQTTCFDLAGHRFLERRDIKKATR